MQTEATDRYAELILADNPVAYWRLSEQTVTETVQDETGHGHHGTIVGNPLLGVAGAIQGSSNRSITIAPESFIEIPHSSEFSIPTSGRGLTVEVWMRPDDFDFPGEPGKHYLHWLGKGEPSQMEWGFRLYNEHDPRFSKRISAYAWNPQGGLGAGAYYKATSQDKGRWLHFVACFEHYVDPCDRKTGVQAYVNGEFLIGPPNRGTLYLNPGNWSVVPRGGNAPLRFGTRSATTGSFLHGGLDEVAIYPYLLSPDQIKRHFEVGRVT